LKLATIYCPVIWSPDEKLELGFTGSSHYPYKMGVVVPGLGREKLQPGGVPGYIQGTAIPVWLGIF